MGGPARFNFMFTPNQWALPFSFGVAPFYHYANRLTEIGICVGPFGLSILIGKLTGDPQ